MPSVRAAVRAPGRIECRRERGQGRLHDDERGARRGRGRGFVGAAGAEVVHDAGLVGERPCDVVGPADDHGRHPGILQQLSKVSEPAPIPQSPVMPFERGPLFDQAVTGDVHRAHAVDLTEPCAAPPLPEREIHVDLAPRVERRIERDIRLAPRSEAVGNGRPVRVGNHDEHDLGRPSRAHSAGSRQHRGHDHHRGSHTPHGDRVAPAQTEREPDGDLARTSTTVGCRSRAVPPRVACHRLRRLPGQFECVRPTRVAASGSQTTGDVDVDHATRPRATGAACAAGQQEHLCERRAKHAEPRSR